MRLFLLWPRKLFKWSSPEAYGWHYEYFTESSLKIRPIAYTHGAKFHSHLYLGNHDDFPLGFAMQVFVWLIACMYFLSVFPPFLQPYFPQCSIKKTATVSVEWLLFGGCWQCLSYLINTGNRMYTGMRGNVQKMMSGVAVSFLTFLRHQNWCRVFTPPWPQYCHELHAGKGSGEPTGSREMLQRENTSWNSLENWDLEQGKNGSKHYVPSHQEMSMQGLIFLILKFLLSYCFFFSLWYINFISSVWFPFVNGNPW